MIKSKSLRWVLVFQLLLLSVVVSQEQVLPPCEQAQADVEEGVQRTKEMVKALYPDPENIQKYYTCYWEYLAPIKKEAVEGPPMGQQTVVLCVLSLIAVALIAYALQDFDPLGEITL